MSTEIYVNLPVKDLEKTMTFFTHLGFIFNEQFTDDKAACMVMGEHIFVMLVVEEFFRTFTKKAIADAMKTTESILCLTVESRAAVDERIEKAVEAGGTSSLPAQDHGWMYARGFEDIDGHLWEACYIDPHGPADN